MNYTASYSPSVFRPVLFFWAVLLLMIAPVFAMAALALLALTGIALLMALAGAIVAAPFLIFNSMRRRRAARAAVRVLRLRPRVKTEPLRRAVAQTEQREPSPGAAEDDDPWSLDPLSPLP